MRPTPAPGARHGRFIVYVFLAALAGPIGDIAGGRTPTWLALPALAGFVASFVLFVELAHHPGAATPRAPVSPRRQRVLRAVFAAMVALAIATSLRFGDRWLVTFIFVVVTSVFTAPARWAPAAILAIAATCMAVALVPDSSVSALAGAGSWALSITMCGFLALLMRRRGALIEELRAAQGEVARLAAADAVIEERLRFARDLHDLLGHSLSVIALKAELARRLLDDGGGRARAQAEVGDLEQIARRALDEVREAVSGYRARSLDGELEHAVAALEAAGVAVTTRNARPALPRDVDDLLAWVVREATTNILRHSQARRAEIALSAGDGVARLEMCNDGVIWGGGPASSGDATGGGSGLIGLRERVAAAGGQLTATSDAGRWFRVVAVVPLGEAPAALSEVAR